MLAKDLKQLVKKNDSVKVRIIAAPADDGEGNLSDFGDSMAGISTYIRTGMTADITDACEMPVIHENLLDAKPYHDLILPGRIYFVFHHAPYTAGNEQFAEKIWTNDSPKDGELSKGTAIQTGCYSGYDMIGFPADEDMSKLLEIIETD